RQPRRPLRARPALPAARAGRPLRSRRPRLSPRAPGHRALRDRAQAPGRDPRVLGPRGGVQDRRARPGASRRRQPPWPRAGPDPSVKPLEQTILALRGRGFPEGPGAPPHLGWQLPTPGAYVPETHQRLALYKRLSEVRSPAEIDALRAEIRDRFGPLPVEVEGLLTYATLRPRAEKAKVSQVDAAGGRLVGGLAPRFPLGPLPALL